MLPLTKNRIIYSILGLLLCLVGTDGFGQKETYNWFFGTFAGIDFNSGYPVIRNDGAMYAIEGSITMSDSTGNLLFYSNGERIWNRNHVPMTNGWYLHGSRMNAQPCLAILKPGSDHIYYLFTVGSDSPYCTPGAFYSVIDMNLDGGLGDIVAGMKDIQIPNTDSVRSHVVGIKHANKKDYWVIFRNFNTNNYFTSYLFDENGLHSNPEKCYTITSHPLIGAGWPVLKLSTDAKYLCTEGSYVPAFYGSRAIELYKLDNTTGKLNPLFIFPVRWQPFGMEFSANSKYLYLNYGFSSDTVFFRQYNMKYLSNASAFVAGSQEIYREIQGHEYHNMQLAPNGKIYIDRLGTTAPDAKYLSAINYPEQAGTACTFEEEALYLEGGNCMYGMPNFIPSYFSKFDWLNSCRGDTTKFTSHFLPPPDSVRWNFDDVGSGTNNTSTLLNPAHFFTGSGTFNVYVVGYYSNGHNDTATRDVKITPYPAINLGNDITVCKGDTVTLDAGFGILEYLWNTEATTRTITASDTGMYSVRVENQNGCAISDSVRVSNFPDPVLDQTNLNIAPTTCKGITGAITGLKVNGNPPYTYQWTEKISGNQVGDSIDIYHLGVGLYELSVTDAAGCSKVLTTYTIQDVGELLIDTAFASPVLCGNSNGSLTVKAVSGLGNMLQYFVKTGNDTLSQWHNGTFDTLQGGTYFVWVSDSSGCTSVYPDEIIVEKLTGTIVASVSTTPETGTNKDGTINVNASGNGLTFSLNGSVPQNIGTFGNLSAGTYSIKVTDAIGCDTLFYIEVTNLAVIRLTAIAGDGSACLGNVAVLPLLANSFEHVKSFKALLKYNSTLVTCQNHLNVNPALFADSLHVDLFPASGELSVKWTGKTPVSLQDGSTLVELSFASLNAGQDSLKWDISPGICVFTDSLGNSINRELIQGKVRVYSIPEADVTQPLTTCEGADLQLAANYHTGTGNGTISYLWSGPGGFASDTNSITLTSVTPASAGQYSVSLSDTNHCQNQYSTEVSVTPTPVSGFTNDTLLFDQTYTLEATPGYYRYTWSTTDSTYSITVTAEGWYKVTLTTTGGCTVTDSVLMLTAFAPLTMPNAFTPNGDILNDVFKAVTTPEKIRSYTLYIYDRWGKQVYFTNDVTQGWDGTIDGAAAPVGTYVYYVKYSNTSDAVREKRGMVVLVR